MADQGGFDPCECVCSSQRAMQRLLSVLRTSQQHCTENECFTEIGPLNDPNAQNQQWNMMFAGLLWFLVMVVLFFTRPRSMRRQDKAPLHDDDHNNGNNHPPPDVPPVQ